MGAGVTRNLDNGGSVSLTGRRDANTDAYGANLSVKLPWPGEGKKSKPAPSAIPTLPNFQKRKEIIRHPTTGKWVYSYRYYDSKGERRGEIITDEEAPDPQTLIKSQE